MQARQDVDRQSRILLDLNKECYSLYLDTVTNEQ